MIEKIDIYNGYKIVDWLHTIDGRCGAIEVNNKINELVDAVNDITDWIKRTDETIVKYGIKPIPEKIAQGFKNLQDPYAEQRKWIGKLCKFWFADAEHPTFGILDFVDAGPHPEPFHINCGESEQGWYPHCEPVKPDDDVIYKGGDNGL